MLHFIKYSEMVNWSALQHLPAHFGYDRRFPLVAIGEFLKQTKNAIEIRDEVEYKQITVRTANGGVVLRGRKFGKEIGTKQQWVARSGQFILSKIDARNGAMGIVPPDLDNAIVTHDFPLFEIDTTRINPNFFLLVITTESFRRFAQSCSRGTTNRQRVDIVQFLAQQIPLPPLKTQDELVRDYQEVMAKVTACVLTKQCSSSVINMEISKILKLSARSLVDRCGLNFIEYKDLERWDYQFYKSKKALHSLFPLVRLDRLIKTFLTDSDGNSLRYSTQKEPNRNFTYIGMEHIEKDNGRLAEVISMTGEQIKSQTFRIPREYILYGKLRPYLNKYWVNTLSSDHVVCSTEFFVFDVKQDVVLKDFFVSILASDFVQSQIVDATSGARMPRITENTFKSIQIPLPPLAIQQEIVKFVRLEKAKAESANKDAERLRQSAITCFERAIFNLLR